MVEAPDKDILAAAITKNQILQKRIVWEQVLSW